MAGRGTRKSRPTAGRERQQQYMEQLRADPERFEVFKQKEKERYHRNKTKTKKPTERENRHQQKRWRESQKKCREKKKTESEERQRMQENSPPISPPSSHDANSPQREPECSTQKNRGRKQVRRDRSCLYRKVKSLERALVQERRRAERLKKRLQRINKTFTNNISTPEKETRQLLGDERVSHGVRKSLLFGAALRLAIQNRYKNSKSYKEKQCITKMLSARLRRYKLSCTSATSLGIPRQSMKYVTSRYENSITHYDRKVHNSLARRLAESIREFFCRDDNSRITTSKHDTKSRYGVKKQRRILTETLNRLHTKYCMENPTRHISYSLFCKMRPFYVVPPTNEDRETCLCKLHENGRMIVERLQQLKRLPCGTNDVQSCVKAAVCTEPNMNCYERKCSHCKNNLKFTTDVANPEDTVTWHKWMTTKEERIIKGKPVQVQRTVKMAFQGTVAELQQVFEALLPALCWHLKLMKHQFGQYYISKEKETPTVIIDFSENYTCGHVRAIQSAHFGASNNQLALHTGVAYIANKTLSFCTVSDCTRHDPASIWAHLSPVIQYLKEQVPGTTFINFWSDGPTTQYRNKHNFAVLSQIEDQGLEGCTWNFFEAGHGKGAADAIGGILKRTADQAVNTGAIIDNAQSFVDVVGSRTKVALFIIKGDDVTVKDDYIRRFVGLKPIRGTMKLHQVQVARGSQSAGLLSVRNLSCFCSYPDLCDCFDAHHVTVALPHPVQVPQLLETIETTETRQSMETTEIMATACATDTRQPVETADTQKSMDSTETRQSAETAVIADTTETRQSAENMETVATAETTETRQSAENMETVATAETTCTETRQSAETDITERLQPGQFILVKLPSAKNRFVAKITKIRPESELCLKLLYMAERGGLYYWPSDDDKSWEPSSVLIKGVPPPVPMASKSTSRRIFYEVFL